ncbi:DUF2628 domain-containing protein [Clostridium cibarium]|uniref:DUF2628 domain-containing protein n=1 Tax=Clostridium cibarium TaxID=2762247 RepID=A0ABR8PUI9_9CLOT|nr:DUF2628 domain-containing protein [Clostridium cibarium]MBD7911812.1 DUF2628 domain-containing protein [Clostridium cibarium]
MFCTYCGHELNSNNVCHNSSCPSNINSNYSTGQNNKTNNYSYQSYNRNSYLGYNCDPNFIDKNGISASEMIQFMGDKNPSFYIDKWTSSDSTPRYFSWIWPAFFFSWIWLFYRKLNLFGAIYFVIHLVSIIFFPSIFPPILLIGNTLCALFSSHFYLKNCIKKINQIKFSNMDMDMYYRRLRNAGKVSIAGLVIGIIVSIIMIFSALANHYIPSYRYHNHYRDSYNYKSPKITDPYYDDDSDYSDSLFDDYYNDDSNSSLFDEPYSNDSSIDNHSKSPYSVF